MVYNSSQSALYKAIDRYNRSESEGDFRSKKDIERKSEDTYEKNASESAEKSLRNERKNRCESCPKSRANYIPSDPIHKIMSDRDMLLIAGLIFILMKENADKTLILALVIVLLG